jgi:hypothetical protein
VQDNTDEGDTARTCQVQIIWQGGARTRLQMPMPASGRHGRVRLAPHGAAVGIGPRRVLLWSTLVVSNYGLRFFVPKPSNDVDEQGCAYLGWEEPWLREDTEGGSMARVVDSLAVGGEVAGDFTRGLGPHERLGVGVPGIGPGADADL